MDNSLRCPIRTHLITFGILLASLLPTGHHAAGLRRDSLSAAAYIERGKQVAQRYQAYGRRLAAYHASLAAAVKQEAPDVLVHLQPRGPVLTGYQVLPPILLDTAAGKSAPSIVAYSWPWTDHLIDRASQEIASSEAMLRRAKETARQNSEILKTLALDYPRLSSQRANIHEHIQYNRLWQAAIAADRPGYEQETILQGEVLEHQKIANLLHRMSAASERSDLSPNAPLKLSGTSINLTARAASLTRRINAALSRLDTPEFVSVENYTGRWLIRVPLFTDIEDHEFVHTVQQMIENSWQASDSEQSYRVQLDITFITPGTLYPNRANSIAGQKLDVPRHLSRFPSGGAILTTGGLTTYVQNHAIILGSQGVTPQVLAHEFGHILGFRDRYVRGYRNLGKDGFLVMELVADSKDIMAATSDGAVLPRHFQRIINRRAAEPQILPASKSQPLPRLDDKAKLS
jgi:hypothetical protein